MRKRLYKAIIARLKAKKIPVRHYSLWNQDVFNLKLSKAFKTPAVFIEFEDIDWKQLQNRARAADIKIKLHIVTATLATPEDGSPRQDQALECLDLIENITNALVGFDGEGFNAFALVHSHHDHDHEEVWHNEETFSTHVIDQSGKPDTLLFTGADLKIKEAPE